MMHVTKGKLTAIMWDSIGEPAEYTKSGSWKLPTNKNAAARYIKGERDTDPQTWFGAPSVSEMFKRFREGWADGSRRLLEIATRDINPASIRRRRVRADQGDEVDMQAIWRGDMGRAWTRTRRQNRTGVRSVAIVMNLGASAGTDASRLFWRGASALKLADALTEAGYSVAIYGAITAAGCDVGDDVDSVQFVEVKAEDQPLDLDKLAALSAMPGFFRTSGFAGICLAADMNQKQVCSMLGVPNPDSIKDAAALMPMIPEAAYIQPPVLDQKAAEAWIDSVLGQIEQPLAA